MGNSFTHRFIYKIRKTISRGRPLSINIGTKTLSFPPGHDLPDILKRYPGYAQNLVRLVKHLTSKYRGLRSIDVGANVGDSAAFIRSVSKGPIACIEGSQEYFNYLEKNVEKLENIQLFKLFLGDRDGLVNFETRSEKGTLVMIKSAEETCPIKISTIDTFVSHNPEWTSSKLLKIDTDGFDLKIVKGALKYIKKTKPVIFLEYARQQFELTGEKGIDTLFILGLEGYEKILFYDNYGRFLVSSELSNRQNIEELHNYTFGKVSAFPYFDLAIFHKQDRDIADRLSQEESIINSSGVKRYL